eukprot:339316-Rhodomonas_salina.1
MTRKLVGSTLRTKTGFLVVEIGACSHQVAPPFTEARAPIVYSCRRAARTTRGVDSDAQHHTLRQYRQRWHARSRQWTVAP